MSRSLYDKLYRRFGTTLSESEVVRRSKKLIEADRALFAPSVVPPPCARLQQTKVAIVGGGFAGIMAAWTLCHRERDIEVVLFEGGPDVGGRVNSDDTFTNGRVIDFGAELVGANHPRMLDLATVLGVTLMTRTGENDYDLFQLDMKFRVDGKDIDRKTGKQINDEMDQVFFEIAKDAKLIRDPASPWTQPDLQKFDLMSVDDKLTKPSPVGLGLPRDKLLFKSLEMLLKNNLVVPLDKMNYLGLLCLVKAGRFGTDEDDARDGEDRSYLGFWQQTEVYRCADGNQTIARRMAAKLGDRKEKFKFTLLSNTRVKEITFDETQQKPVKLAWDSSPAADRRQPNPFDYVILATPPTVWSDIAITPEHPVTTLGQLQTGPAVKFFSNLKDRFWFAERAAPSGISSEIGMIWEGTDNQMLVGKQEIELSVFAGGLTRGHILTESEFKEGLKKLYPGYAESNRGKKTKLVSWPAQKLIKTGYSNPRVGHIFTVAPQLQVPLNRGRMFLAGEHTQTDFFGFMEGALRSGQRVAESVIARVCPRAAGEV